MNTDILSYIQQNNGAELAMLQQKFGLSYKEAKAIVDELVSKGALVFDSGLKYSYVKKTNEALEKCRADAIREIQGSDSQDETAEEKAQAERRAYLEARRQELLRRMRAEMEEDDDEDEEEDDNDDDDDEGDMDEEELRFRALKLCIEKNVASISLFQRTFPIGYLRSCKLVEWMESKGYVSKSQGSKPREVFITKEEFEKLYNEPHLITEERDDDDDDDGFAEYEKFLKQHLSDEDSEDEDEEDEIYDNIINRIFYSDADDIDVPNADSSERKIEMQNLTTVLSKICDKKKATIDASTMPLHPSWDNEDEFAKAVMDRLERLVRSDKRMGQQGAVKKAETYLEAVRDTRDRKMVQVYERLVYEIKNTSGYLYGQLKKQFFDE